MSYIQPALANTGKMNFYNDSSYKVVIDILHSDGTRQKGKTLGKNSGKTFEFNSQPPVCPNKNRGFTIKRKSDSKLIASGSFSFRAVMKSSGSGATSTQYCKMNVREPDYSSESDIESTFKVKYDKKSDFRGQFKIKNADGHSSSSIDNR